MEKEERKGRIAKLRKWHEGTFELLGNPNSYYCCKVAHYAKDGDTEKVVGLFASECQKGDNVYVEFCTHDYTPIDPSRRLYVWEHDATKLSTYEIKKNQFLVPVSDLKPVVTVECKLPIEGKVYSDKSEYVVTPVENYAHKIVSYKDEAEGVEHIMTYRNEVPYQYEMITKTGRMCLYSKDTAALIKFIKQLK